MIRTSGETAQADGWLEESGRVVGTFAGGAWVVSESRAGCGGCAVRQGCGSSLLTRWRRTPRLALHTDQALEIGDRVRVGIPARRFLQGALIVYGWPLLLAICAGGITEGATSPGHVSVPLAFVAGLALGLLASRYQLRCRQRHYRPCLLAIESPPAPAAAFFRTP